MAKKDNQITLEYTELKAKIEAIEIILVQVLAQIEYRNSFHKYFLHQFPCFSVIYVIIRSFIGRFGRLSVVYLSFIFQLIISTSTCFANFKKHLFFD